MTATDATPTTSFPSRSLRRLEKRRFRKTRLFANRPPSKRRSRLAANRRVVLLGPFGEPLAATGTVAAEMPFRFSTKYQDAETGLLYYGYRYYDAITGRWLNRDPIREMGGANLFAFCFNNSLDAVDDNGRQVLLTPLPPVLETFIRVAPEVGNRLAPLERPMPFVRPGVGADGPPQMGPSTNPVLRPLPPVPLVPPNPDPNPNPHGNPDPKPAESDPPGAYYYRSMAADPTGTRPLVGPNARTLGVRPDTDVELDFFRRVHPKDSKGKYQGMSVSPGTPNNLFWIRRPKELIGAIPGRPDGTGGGKDPVWRIPTNRVPPWLDYYGDGPTHGVIGVKDCMDFDTFQSILADSRMWWERVDLSKFK